MGQAWYVPRWRFPLPSSLLQNTDPTFIYALVHVLRTKELFNRQPAFSVTALCPAGTKLQEKKNTRKKKEKAAAQLHYLILLFVSQQPQSPRHVSLCKEQWDACEYRDITQKRSALTCIRSFPVRAAYLSPGPWWWMAATMTVTWASWGTTCPRMATSRTGWWCSWRWGPRGARAGGKTRDTSACGLTLTPSTSTPG